MLCLEALQQRPLNLILAVGVGRGRKIDGTLVRSLSLNSNNNQLPGRAHPSQRSNCRMRRRLHVDDAGLFI